MADNRDDEIAAAMRQKLADAVADGRDRHAAPERRDFSWLGVQPEPVEQPTQTAAELAAYERGWEQATRESFERHKNDPPVVLSPDLTPTPKGRAAAYVALGAALAVELAELVLGDRTLLAGLPESVSGPVLTVAQVLLVFVAAYRARR
jgi:hypothetical protein